jgi:hypothetical protein
MALVFASHSEEAHFHVIPQLMMMTDNKDNSVRSFIQLLANRYSPLLTSSYNSQTVKKNK